MHKEDGPKSPPQKRQLTVLFVDIVGSTQFTQGTEIELAHACIGEFFSRCDTEIRAAGGVIARFMGDGVLAYFGHPVALENMAGHAVDAAIRLRKTCSAIALPNGEKMQLRCGIATGEVVVGSLIGTGVASELPITGEAAILASRLQEASGPNAIFVSELTQRLARRHFVFKDLGAMQLKGFVKRQRAYEVVGIRSQANRTFLPNPSSTRLVGRRRELELLLESWTKARTGIGGLVSVTGEAGIGKTRLVTEFRFSDYLGDAEWLEVRGNPFASRRPFAALRELGLGDGILDLIPNDDAANQDTSSRPDRNLAARIISAFLNQFCAQFGNKRCVLVLEDFHWLDSGTVEFAKAVASEARDRPWLVVVTSREPEASLNATDVCFHELQLEPLGASECAALVQKASRHKLRKNSVDLAAKRSGGNPLFAIELANWMTENRSAADKIKVPETLAEILVARLDLAEPALPVMQALAIMSGEGSASALAALLDCDERSVHNSFSRLAALGIVERTGDGSVFEFTHALLRDAAYQSIMTPKRLALHCKAAKLIEDGTLSAKLEGASAYHWRSGERFEQAIGAMISAAKSAHRSGRYLDAQSLLEEALVLLEKVAPAEAQDNLDLRIQSLLASVLQVTLGYSAPATRAAAKRADILANRLGDWEEQFQQATGQWMAFSSAGKFLAAIEAADRVMALAVSQGGERSLGIAWMAQLTAHCRVGNLDAGENAFVAGHTLFGSCKFQQIPGAVAQALGNGAIVALLRGEVAEARRRGAAALNHARRSRLPYERAFGCYMVAMLSMMHGGARQAKQLSRMALDVSNEHDFPQFAATSRIVMGRALGDLGKRSAALHEIHIGLEEMARAETRVGLSMYLTWLAEVELLSGDLAGAAQTIEDALAVNREEKFFLPETLRLKSVLLARNGQADAARLVLDKAAILAEAGGSRWHRRRVTVTRSGILGL